MDVYDIISTISAGTLDTDKLALVVTAIAVACFTVVFTVLFVNYRKFACAELESGKRDIELIEQYFLDKKKSYILRKKALSILKTVLYTLVMAFITMCLVFTVFVRFSQKMPNGTKSLMAIATDSMSEKNTNNDYLSGLNNQFPAQSIIVLEKVDPSEIKQYDVVAFKLPSGITLVHRVRAILQNEDGSITYLTRGDKYATDDKGITLTPDDVVGKYTGKYIPYFGAFVLFLQSASGIVTVIALIFCLVMFDKNTGKISKTQQERTEYLVKELDIQDIHEDSEITVDFVEKIYLDKVGYMIKDNGVKIRRIDEEEKLFLTDGKELFEDDDIATLDKTFYDAPQNEEDSAAGGKEDENNGNGGENY